MNICPDSQFESTLKLIAVVKGLIYNLVQPTRQGFFSCCWRETLHPRWKVLIVLSFFFIYFFYFYLFIYLFIYGCLGSSFLCEGFL